MSKRRETRELLYLREIKGKVVELVQVGNRYILTLVDDSGTNASISLLDPTISTPPIIPARP